MDELGKVYWSKVASGYNMIQLDKGPLVFTCFHNVSI